jgi:hypothetical protein
MGDNFLGYFRRVTTGSLKVNGQCRIGEKAVIAGTGKTYYVDSGASNAADTNDGRSWSKPLATLDGAINKCTSNQGDVILLAEGHAESWTTTGVKFTADVAGITIISLGEGSNRATFTFGHTGTTSTISAANVTIENCLFVTAVDSVVTYGTISGADCKLINCEFRDATDKEVISDWTITGDRFKAIGCFKNGYTSGNANARVFSLNGVDNALIKDCILMTKVTTAVVNFVTTACTNVVVDNCIFYVNGTTNYSKTVVDTITGSSWIVTNGYDLGAGAKFSGGSGGALAGDDVSAVSSAIAVIDAFHDVPTADSADNAVTSDVVGNKTDTVAGDSVVALLKQVIVDTGTDVPALLATIDGIVDAILVDTGTDIPALISAVTDALHGATGIAAFPAGAAAANDVSMAEVLRYAQENIINGTGTALPANQSLYDLLSGTNGIATFPASAAPANNVSLAEVLRDIWDSLRNGTGGSEPGTNLSIVDELKRGMVHYNNPNYLAVTADLTSATFNTVATHELFTVTGLVRMRVIAEVTTTGDDTSGNTSTIQLGTEDATNGWIAATEVDDLAAGEIWADATPTETNGNYSSLVFDKVVNGVDVGYEIAGEAATDGVIVFHCVWEPINATGAVVAGDGSAMV